jgi:hypothetical protein
MFGQTPSADARVPPEARALVVRGEVGGESRAEVVQIARTWRRAIYKQARNRPEVHSERARHPIEILGGRLSNARGDPRRLRR